MDSSGILRQSDGLTKSAVGMRMSEVRLNPGIGGSRQWTFMAAAMRMLESIGRIAVTRIDLVSPDFRAHIAAQLKF
jgi:hypothetical protein